MVSGLASSIRAATESATFDLAGHDAASIRLVTKDAFSQPLTLSEMIRITFVVGGGKLSRSKYDDKAMQALTSTLKQLEYVEDRGASCILECAGCYKTQHDTGKNVFTVVVFPTVAANENTRDGKYQTYEEEYEPLIPTNSPGYKMAVCTQQTFRNLLSTYCPTYTEKKACLRTLEGLLQVEQAIENKMMNGQPLDSAEQAFYDESSEMKEKYAHAQTEATRHVEESRITKEEKRVLVEMNENRIESLMNEKSSASTAEKLKKALARKRQLQSLTEDALSDPHPLRYESQINGLRKKTLPLRTLEESARGRLLTLAETRSLTEKEEMEEEILRLEEASCGWFEEEEPFQERLERSREKFESKFAKKRRTAGGKMSVGGVGKVSGNASAVNKWILPGEKPKSAWGASAGGKGKLKGKGGAVFTAMMMDSSSDEEEESDDDDDEESVEQIEVERPFAATKQKKKPQKQHPAASNVLPSKKTSVSSSNKNNNLSKPTKSGDAVRDNTDVGKQQADTGSSSQSNKKNKKKKKKSKNKKSKAIIEHEDEDVVEETDESKAALSSSSDATPKVDSASTVSQSLLVFLQSFLLPLIMAILNLLFSLVMWLFSGGKKSKKSDKKKRG